MPRWLLVTTLALVALGVAASLAAPLPSGPAAVRLLFGGDVMLGRGVAPVVARAPPSVSAGIRFAAGSTAVGIHAGVEYVPATDPYELHLGRLLASWGADVVWGTGPHVAQPITVIDPDRDGRPTVVATSLGNLLFDQHIPGTGRGAIVEVLAGRNGVRALRVGVAAIADGRVRLAGWRAPRGSAVALREGWWQLTRPVKPVPLHRPAVPRFKDGDVVSAALGDADGDGRVELAVSFRRRFRPTNVSALFPRRRLVDSHGRAAHVGLYRPRD